MNNRKSIIAAVLAAVLVSGAIALNACASSSGGGSSSGKAGKDSEVVLTFNTIFRIADESGNTVHENAARVSGVEGLMGSGTRNTTLSLPNGKYTIYAGTNQERPLTLFYSRARVSIIQTLAATSADLLITISQEYMGSAGLVKAMDTAVTTAFRGINSDLRSKLPQNAALAVFPVNALHAEIGEMALEGLTVQFINAGYTVVEKRRMEEILAEYDFQNSGAVDEKTLGELLGADAIIFGSMDDSGQLTAWVVDTGKRSILAKTSVQAVTVQKPKPKAIPPVPFPKKVDLRKTDPGLASQLQYASRSSVRALEEVRESSDYDSALSVWASQAIAIASANSSAVFPPRPSDADKAKYTIEDTSYLGKAQRAWDNAQSGVKGNALLVLPVLGSNSNEGAAIASFIANDIVVNRYYTVVDKSADTSLSQYAGNFTNLTWAQRGELSKLAASNGASAVISGAIQQVGRKNVLMLSVLKGTINEPLLAVEYADIPELRVKMQYVISRYLNTEISFINLGGFLYNLKSNAPRKSAYINSQFGTGANRAEAEMFTSFLIADTISIPYEKINLTSFMDGTRIREAGQQRSLSGTAVNLNWSRTGNRNRVDAEIGQQRYSMEYGSQQEFTRKLRGLSVFILSKLAGSEYDIRGFEGYNLSTVAATAPVPSNYRKLTFRTPEGIAKGSFHIANAPVTQRDYESIMRQNPSAAKDPSQPVTNVSVTDAMLYCNQMSIRDGLEPVYIIGTRNQTIENVGMDRFASGYRLPSTEEWDFAVKEIDSVRTFGGGYIYNGEEIKSAKTGNYIFLVRPVMDFWKYAGQ